jgi:hypothetical protein
MHILGDARFECREEVGHLALAFVVEHLDMEVPCAWRRQSDQRRDEGAVTDALVGRTVAVVVNAVARVAWGVVRDRQATRGNRGSAVVRDRQATNEHAAIRRRVAGPKPMHNRDFIP